MIIFYTWSVIIKNAKLIWRIEKWYISVVEDSPVGKKLKIATGKCYPCSVKFHKEVAIDSTHMAYSVRAQWTKQLSKD